MLLSTTLLFQMTDHEECEVFLLTKEKDIWGKNNNLNL